LTATRRASNDLSSLVAPKASSALCDSPSTFLCSRRSELRLYST